MMHGSAKKYILFIIISFIISVGAVRAAESSLSGLTYQGSPYVVRSDEYINLECNGVGELHVLSLTPSSAGYEIRFVNKTSTTTTDTILCKWSGQNKVGKETEAGSRTYNFTYNVDMSAPDKITIALNGTSADDAATEDVIHWMNVVGLKNVYIKSAELIENSELVNLSNCSGTTCTASPTTQALNKGENLYAAARVVYTADGLEGDQTVKIEFVISYTGGIKLYPGDGTCNFGSIWKYNNEFKYYGADVVGNVTLPDCTPNEVQRNNSSVDKTGGLLEFKGWVMVNDNKTTVSSTTGCPGAVKGNVNSEKGGSYVACYAYKGGVQLSGVDKNVSDFVNPGTCKETDNRGTYYCTASGTFILPEVKQKDTALGQRKKFVGWVKDNAGAVLKPGTPVEIKEKDYGTYYARYETTIKEVDRYKSIPVGKTSSLVVPGMVSCSVVDNANLKVSYQNNECIVTGLKATNPNVFVDVTVGVKNDEGEGTVTYKFQVVDQGNKSEANNGEFVIDIDARVVSGETNSSALNDFDHEMCDFARVSFTGSVSTVGNGLESNNYEATCDPERSPGFDESTKYFALCMDPGRSGPSNDLYNISEHISQGSDLGKMIGVIIQHINRESSPEAFDDADNPVRIAAHVAIRTVVLINGYSGVTEYSDTAVGSHYDAYLKLSQELKQIYDKYKVDDNGRVPKSTDPKYDEFKNAINSAVDSFGVVSSASGILKEMFIEYKNYEYDEGSAFQRTIDSKETVVTGDNSYTVTYKGKITLPVDAHLSGSYSNYQYLNKAGVTGTATLTYNSSESTSDPKQEVYDYVVVINVTDAKGVEVPQNPQKELEYSLKLSYSGGIDYSSIRIGNPSAGSASKQRMIIFDLKGNDTNIYFNINGNTDTVCSSVAALDYTKCTSESSCDPSFNKELFKASGCCREVLDEVTYSYVVSNVCNGECTVSTMSNVCSYDPDYTGSVDLYEIKEGAYYTSESQKYTNAIGTCIVNVRGNYARDYEDLTESYSSHGEPSGKDNENYFKYDDRGNSINVSSYQNNRYCQVSCREDWKLTMGAFGNFVGKNAVMASRFFQNHDNDIFIEGGRTCYTTYLDYDKFMEDVVTESKKLVAAYNEYSNQSHSYSDVKAQTSASETLVFNTENECVKYQYYVNKGTLEDGSTDTKSTGWYCTQYNSSLDSPYGYFSLDLDHKFTGDGDSTEGTYHNYQPSNGTTSDPLASNTTPQYEQDQHKGSCSWPPAPSGSANDGDESERKPTNLDSGDCFAGETGNRDTAFTKLSEEMMNEEHDAMTGSFGAMSAAYNNIVSYYEQFWNCQHFELANDSGSGKVSNTMNYDTFMGKKKAFNQIITKFEPFVSYDYDESTYMTILQDDNILIEYDDLNDNFFEAAGQPKDYGDSTNVSVGAKVGFTDRCVLNQNSDDCVPTEPIDVRLSRNKLDFEYYKPNSPWSSESDVRNYGRGDDGKPTGFNACNGYDDDGECNKPLTIDGKSKVVNKQISVCSIGTVGTGSVTVDGGEKGDYTLTTSARVDDWEGGKCFNYNVYYLEAHYIEASIKNSSFYRNKGIWYTGPNDTREHGETLEEAWANAAKRNGPSYNNENPDDWSVFVGTKIDDGVIEGNLNIFPISMTTPRNLYQYTYEFTQIGSYTDGRLGRVMGDAASLIPQNTRTCFYEVVENICLCCGDPIVSYTNEGYITGEEFAEQSGYNFDFNKDINEEAEKGILSFNTSTVALSDLNGSTDRTLGNNWTEKGAFYYGGNKLQTNKGAVALEEIQDIGEKVYLNDGDATPEYSFELKPATLAAIRNYNDMYGYEVNFDNLTLYGRSSIQPLGSCSDPNNCKWFPSSDEENDEMSDRIANFGHYGSNFLENFDKLLGTSGAASTENLSNKDRDLDVCAIVKNNNVTSAKDDLRNEINSGKCRWIDYIEVAENVQNLWDSSPKTQYYRLAFK